MSDSPLASNPRLLNSALLLLASVLTIWTVVEGVVPTWNDGGGDFANFYTASKIVTEGEPLESAYTSFTWFQQQMDRVEVRNQLGGFIPHPPPAALLLLPLAPLDPLTAKRVWTLFNVALALVCVFLLARVSGMSPLLAGCVLLLTGAGLQNNFLFGQLYLLLLASILGGLYFFQLGRPVLAGLCLGSLAPVKYVGLLFLGYFAWRREWKLLVTAGATIAALLLTSLWLAGSETFAVFWTHVLPRHLGGEIQDPFAIRLQSWASLFRRLLVADAALNPRPVADLPFLYFVCKNAVHWLLLAATFWVLSNADFTSPRQTSLFRWGWLAMVPLLVSPGGATYHFLLLTIAATFFAQILLEQGRTLQGWALVALFAAVNLPHYLWLEKWAAAGWAPLAYSRLWLLTGFAGFALLLFRASLRKGRNGLLWTASFLAVAGALAARDIHRYQDPAADGAYPLALSGGEFQMRGGQLQTAPDFGSTHLVFSSMERDPDGYAIYDGLGDRWGPSEPRNAYAPDLAADDRRLLVETVVGGELQIWLSPGPGEPFRFLVTGSHPSWSPDGRSLVFERDGEIHRLTLDGRSSRRLPIEGRCHDPVFLHPGDAIACTVRGATRDTLKLFNLVTGRDREILSAPGRISSPSGSPDGKILLFSWEQSGDQNLWAIRIADQTLVQLTHHRGNDDDAVWDASNDRIVFASDRGRGLGYETLFATAAPTFAPLRD